MLADLDVLIFIKSNDALDRLAERVFNALKSQSSRGTTEKYGEDSYWAEGLGFTAVLYPNSGDVQDVEFEEYGHSLEISSQFSCVELDAAGLEAALSEYFARLLAFDLNLETAVAVFLEEQGDVEVFERRAYSRNTQYRSDSGPTVPKVHVVETREFEIPIGEDQWDEDENAPDEEYEPEAEEE